jgi:HEAT repeat protein
MTVRVEIDRILSKLNQVRRLDPESFGKEKHAFRLNPVLSEQAIQAFEQKHRVSLPEDYRDFLQQAGNGGAGPFYGILPLEEYASLFHCDLSSPSPLCPASTSGWSKQKIDPPDVELPDPPDDWLNGSLALVNQGCAYCAVLIVTGPSRGRVVYVNLDTTDKVYFVHHRDFLSWYERWLDELLAGYETSWFGLGLPATEAEIATLLVTENQPEELMISALQTLERRSKIERPTVEALRICLTSPLPQVRAGAIGILAKHLHRNASSDVLRLLGDPSPKVREAALGALAEADEKLVSQNAPTLLKDPDVDVVISAIHHLVRQKALSFHDLKPLLASNNPGIVRTALWASKEIGESSKILDRHFSDPDKEVRRSALLFSTQENVESVLRRLDMEQDNEILSLVVTVLGRLNDARIVPALIQLKGHSHPFVRYNTAFALGELRDRRAIPVLKSMLSDDVFPESHSTPGMSGTTMSIADCARFSLTKLRPWWKFWGGSD